MRGATLASVAEYLSTSYEPDCEYVDGVVVERNWGERDHSSAQAGVCFALMRLRAVLGIHVFLALRVQVSPTCFRVPDVCVTVGPDPEEQTLSRPPFLCVEVLSREDRATTFQEKIDDYRAFGVPYVWVVNPRSCRAYIHTAEGSHEAKDGVLRTENPDIAIPLADLFAEL